MFRLSLEYVWLGGSDSWIAGERFVRESSFVPKQIYFDKSEIKLDFYTIVTYTSYMESGMSPDHSEVNKMKFADKTSKVDIGLVLSVKSSKVVRTVAEVFVPCGLTNIVVRHNLLQRFVTDGLTYQVPSVSTSNIDHYVHALPIAQSVGEDLDGLVRQLILDIESGNLSITQVERADELYLGTICRIYGLRYEIDYVPTDTYAALNFYKNN